MGWAVAQGFAFLVRSALSCGHRQARLHAGVWSRDL